jgi:pimeloyl-ACP methyl ester carboxylesterase
MDVQAPTQLTATSRDGTRIAYLRTGDGPALILVHGTTADHSRWETVLPLLEPHVTVYAMDRRGRGGRPAGWNVSIDSPKSSTTSAGVESEYVLGRSASTNSWGDRAASTMAC